MPLLTEDVASAWTTKNKDYLKLRGWSKAVTTEKHRKELVAGDLANFAIAGVSECVRENYPSDVHLSEYKGASDRLGDDNVSWMDATVFRGFISDRWSAAKRIFAHLPQV